MKESTSKEKVLKKVRGALIEKQSGLHENVDVDAAVFEPSGTDYPDVEFAEAFSRIGGKFIFVESQDELKHQLSALLKELGVKSLFCTDILLQQLVADVRPEILYLPQDLDRCQASLTFCEALVSRFGSIVMSSRVAGSRGAYSLPPVHIVVASPRQIVPDIKEAFSFIKKKYADNIPTMITFVSGPSRTADIEKTLVMGAHGPKELYLLLTDYQ